LGKIWPNLSEIIWANLGKNLANLGEIWTNLIKFGQNQNLASAKTLDLLYGYVYFVSERNLN